MKNAIRIWSVLTIVFTLHWTAFAAETFVVGVAPHTSARVILQMYQPLRLHLEKALGSTVDIVTAPDFTEFARRALDHGYDLAITTGHQARLLETDASYIPLLTYRADFKAVVVVASNGPVKRPADVQGKNVLGLSPTSLVTLWGEHWMEENRIRPLSMKYVSASDSMGRLIDGGEASAGFMSLANFHTVSPEVKSRLRLLAESRSMAGRVYVLNPRRGREQRKIEAALWSFAVTPEAKKYFEAYRLEGYRKLKPGELSSMDPYAAEVRRTVRENRK